MGANSEAQDYTIFLQQPKKGPCRVCRVPNGVFGHLDLNNNNLWMLSGTTASRFLPFYHSTFVTAST